MKRIVAIVTLAVAFALSGPAQAASSAKPSCPLRYLPGSTQNLCH